MKYIATLMFVLFVVNFAQSQTPIDSLIKEIPDSVLCYTYANDSFYHHDGMEIVSPFGMAKPCDCENHSIMELNEMDIYMMEKLLNEEDPFNRIIYEVCRSKIFNKIQQMEYEKQFREKLKELRKLNYRHDRRNPSGKVGNR